MTLNDLKKGENAIIEDIVTDFIPLKLIEMGCLPGNSIKLLQLAPFNDPMYLDVNGSRVAIRRETANYIIIKKIGNE
ncbi:MAG: ferrous iron transport protein A [Flavobacteriaceae bacterium]|nr:ferrous iron transport protein A [Flavobacteriaceae bacterium]MBT3793935.1 ferrous iron transport protein A [Flavobacteriaceae bacterium]MBT4063577.1 ferrous iron transport protein A [Flavobacteriaceae bacterium]MBT4246028.1 ferrous iron transport protein A [Flavobacteriaceae bacterium]MBT5012460.1 ferrous iron transport protein A [Flavobacteriaceae bacterium]